MGYRRDGLDVAKALVQKDPPITDLETLSLLLKSFENFSVHERPELITVNIKHYVTLLWERALRASPGDETLARECFFSYLQQRDWRNAQKVCRTGISILVFVYRPILSF